MKKSVSLFLLLFVMIIHAQDKVLLKKGEITIPLGKKVVLKPEFKENTLASFEILSEENISGKKDTFEMLKNFKKDDIKDNTIEFTFSEAEMMKNPLFTLVTIQKTGKKMNFKAKIRLRGNSLYHSTSIMPAHSNVVSVEQWRDLIDSIFLYDFELKD